MAKRSVAQQTRARVALFLLVFFVVASAVIFRRSAGVTRGRALVQLDKQRLALESERAKLRTDIQSATSLARLLPVVQPRLGMHVPSDAQVVRLPRPVRAP